MPPIPIYTSSPINTHHPANAFATSPSSAAAARYTPSSPPSISAETTTTGPEPTRTAQAGAPAVPQPTNAVSSDYNTRYRPTPTVPSSTNRSNGSPPPPQPGAVPSPITTQAPVLSIPQPPRPGDTPQSVASPIRHSLPAPTPTRTRPIPLPQHQQSSTIYTPPRGVPPASTTSIYPQDLSHPPGYIQDSRASFDDKPVEFCQPLGHRHSPSSSYRGGILDEKPNFERDDDDESGVLNKAIAWAKAAGKTMSKTEEQIWKKINGDENT